MEIYFKIYAILFLMGIGFSYVLCKKIIPHEKNNTIALLSIAISPLMSYSLTVIASIYFLHFGIDRTLLLLFCKIIFGISLLISVYYLFYFSYRHAISVIKNFPWFFILVALLVIFCFGNYHDGILYHLLNPDIVSYAITADWLSQPSHQLSQINNTTSVYIIEILLRALRWGLPSITGLFNTILNTSSYEIIFPLTFILFASGIMASALFFNSAFNLRHSFTQITAIVALLNGSLLYFLIEGFFPNIVSVAYLTLFLSLFLLNKENPNKMPIFILGSLCIAAIITTYNEVFTIATAVIGFSILISLITRNKTEFKQNTLFLMTILIGFLLVFPLSYKIILFTFANIKNSGNVGYAQPTWLWPSDILGLTNIYFKFNHYLDEAVATQLIHRSYPFIAISLSLSAWGIYELWKSRKNIIFISILICSVLFLFYNYYLLATTGYGPHNYIFDKLVILFSPLYVAFFFAGIYQTTRSSFFKLKIFISLGCVFIYFYLLFHGTSEYRAFVDVRAISSIQNHFKNKSVVFIMNERGYRKGRTWGKLRYIDRASEFIINPLLINQFLDQWGNDPCATFSRSAKIILIVNKKALLDNTHYPKTHRLIYSTRSYEVFDTNQTIATTCPNANTLRLDKIFIK